MAGKTIRCMGCMETFDAEYDVCPHCGYEVDADEHQFLHIDKGSLLADRYIIGRSIGFGGFGVTYLGWDTKLERKVAIKEYLPSEFATRMIHHTDVMIDKSEKKTKQFRDGMTKFLKEGQKLAKVNDINGIVHMYDCFEANNTAYITMEYLQGETLSKYLEKTGPIDEQTTMEMMLPIIQALETVHEKGIIHRDIAPDNLFVVENEDGKKELKLIDFGASKFASTSHSKSLTVIIKPGYSPEEQYRSNGEQGTFTDVYAIAAVMYRMVTGVQPPDSFERRTSIESKRRDLLVEPGKYNKELSANFEIALLNAMNVRVEDRTQSIAEFEEELISFEPIKRRGSSIKKIDFMRWPLWAKIGVPTAGLAAAGLVVFALVKTFSGLGNQFILPEGYTRVPDFVMADFGGEAQDWATNAKLTVSATRTEFSPVAVAGIVLSQEQQAGSLVNENSVIGLVLSTGVESYVMPDVTGMRIYDAKKALECMGIEVIEEEMSQPGLVPGGVVGQSVEAYGTVDYGSKVTLQVNGVQRESVDLQMGAGTEDDAVFSFYDSDIKVADLNGKDLVGKSYDDALKAAADAGCYVCVTKRSAGKGKAENTVLEQTETTDEDGNKIFELVLAMPDIEFELPDLRYKSAETAIQLLKNIGIEVEVQEETSEIVSSGMVTAQDTDGLASAKVGDKLVIHVSTGSKPFEMPSVEGMDEADAKKVIADNNLVINIEYAYDPNVPEGSVISQSVEAGKDVTRGTTTTITVCTTEGLIEIPNIMNLTLADAKNLLKSMGIDFQVDTQDSMEVKDAILGQIPAAGSMQKEGTKVTISTSNGKLLEQKLAAEKAERDRLTAEEARLKEAEDNARRAEEERLALEAEQRRLEEEKKKADEEQQRALEEQQKAQEEADRLARELQEAKDAEEKARLEREKKAAEEAAIAAEEAARAAEEARQKAEEDAKKKAAEEEAAQKKAAEEEAARKKAEEEAAKVRNWHWSDWDVSAPPAGSELESKTEYRYRTRSKEYTESDDPNLSGWEKTSNSRQVEDGWNGWSGWSETRESTSSTKKEDSETRYRYRDNNKTTTYGWSGYSNWQDSAVNAVAGQREVETRTVDDTNSPIQVTQYNYDRWYNGNQYGPCEGTWSGTYCGNHETRGWGEALNYVDSPYSNQVGGNYTHYTDAGGGHWYNEITQLVTVGYNTKTQYRYRDWVAVGEQDNWTSWSDYSTNAVSATNTRQVETKVFYRYATKKYKTIYSYERWGNWSDWSSYGDAAVSANDTTDVDSRVVYRYKIYE